jgi:protein-disulfide isomerase
MKPNVIIALLVGVVLGFAIGKAVTGSKQESPKIVDVRVKSPDSVAQPPESEAALAIKSTEFPAETFAAMSDAQKYAAMKVLNENTCDCGCEFGSYAQCFKKDPNCPFAPAKVKQTVELAKAGKSAAQIQTEMFGGPPKAVAPKAQAQPSDTALFKVPIEGSPAHGKATALVTMVEFSDYQCPFCSSAETTVQQLEKDYGDKLRVVMKQNPLPMHSNARPAAVAALAAGRQDKYWEMHRKLFANQQALDEASLEKHARELGLDVSSWKRDIADPKLQAVIQNDQSLASSLGANGTPGFFINGRKLEGAQPIDSFKRIIDEEVTKAQAMLKEGVQPNQLYAKIMEKASTAPVAAPPSPSGAPTAAVKRIEIPAEAPVLGAKTAKVTIVEWSDFQCPFCSKAVPLIKKIEESYKKEVRVVFRHQPLPFHSNAKLAAEASMAAQEQGKFWAFHDKLFANQNALDRASLEKYAGEVGLNVDKFKAALDGGKFRAKVEADAAAGQAVGANGTPTFFINGRQLVGAQPFESFKPIIDEEIKKANQLIASGTKPEKVYEKLIAQAAVVATDAPVAAAPAPVQQIAVGSAPVKGPRDAPITIVEFSDFQCPFCSKAVPTLKAIEEQYGKKVKLAFKHQPLPFHQNARPAAAAAMAAQEQGKFWEYHDKLFANQQALDRASLERYAQELGLNLEKFKKSLDSNKFESQIAADAAEGQRVGANGTPTFFINGRQLVGAQPIEAFKSLIDEELKKGGAKN